MFVFETYYRSQQGRKINPSHAINERNMEASARVRKT